ncbi:MAG: DUF3987 domain-containing protein [Phycisphaerae bacterium]|nr:MAG: DUF3987 domain-containing protein [Phycisphaerae bacterium]
MGEAAPRDTIQRFLGLLFEPGDVFEVRAPDCRDRPGARYAYVCSGYFTHDTIDQAAQEITELDRAGIAPAIYVTMNPVAPALLARSVNRIKTRARETTQDKDVVHRRWLLVDVDPARPAGVSSTDAELALAAERARAVAAHLSACGWPAPVMVMSGNGYHLLYRLDLPADDEGLVKRVLAALAERFDDGAVTIDRSVYNAARIVKVGGTVSRKGDDLRGVAGLDDRPHRRAQLVEAPDTIRVVSRELLERIAPSVVTRSTAPAPGACAPASDRIDCTPAGVRTWLEAHGVEVKGCRRNGDKTLLLLERCPINPEIVSAGGSDIAVLVGDDGKLAYCNKHNRGQAYTWHDLRHTLEPGWQPPAGDTDVDLSGFCVRTGGTPSADAPVERPTDPGPFPEHLLRVPGFIGDVIDHNLATATRPQPVLALAAAICLQAVLAARKVRDERGNRTNLYCVGIAPSGAGKDHARKVNKNILFQAGLNDLEGTEDLASDAGLVAAVEQQPAILFLLDEFGRFLRTIGDPKKAPHLFNVLGALMKLYSSADTVFRGKAYAEHKRNKVVDQPCVSVYGTTVPEHFFESLTPDSLSDGFIARLLVFEANATPPRQRSRQRLPPDELLGAARWWGDLKPGGNLRGEHPEPLVVPYTPEAGEIFDEFAANVDAELARPDSDGRSLWARAEEKACRLALVYACSVDRDNLQVTADAALWARDLVEYLTRRMLYVAHEWVADGQFDARQKRVLRIVRQAGGRIGRGELCRRTQWLTQRERQEVVENLIETGQLVAVTTPTATKPRTEYALS